MSARLIPLSVDTRTAPIVALQRPVILIGRHPECDIRIDLPQISRRHCCIALAYERVMIRDLGSRNGLRVNGVRVEEAQLHPGDEVAIGQVIYRLEGSLATSMDATPIVRRPAPAPPPSPSPSPPPRPSKPSAPRDDPDADLVPLDDF